MYYGSSSPYTGSPYSYSSSVSPLGSSYSASYLNPGGNYSNHSSLGGYSRAPVASRWITSSGRNYSPMLGTISERGSASPVRINSPRRLPLSTRTYHSSNYTPRPVNINTADIDVSKDKYRHKVESTPYQAPPLASHQNSNEENDKGPFMPRVDGKVESDVSSPSEVKRGTIQRGRTVVRLYTVKRKERDSPRKPVENQQCLNNTSNQEAVEKDDTKTDEKEFMKWREKLSEDLAFKEKKETKTLGAKLVEKFMVKDDIDKTSYNPTKVEKNDTEDIAKLPTTSTSVNNFPSNKCLDRRCSIELMAEQANLLDSLIRSENLSTATLELNKVGIVDNKNDLEIFESLKRQKPDNLLNPIKTTKSDHSLHLKSHKDVRDPKNFSKRRSLKKSSSGSSIRRLDSITEFPKESNNVNLPSIEESIPLIKQENTGQKPKLKIKAKITSSVEVTAPKSPLKFIVENVTVEEKLHAPKKGITYSSEVEEITTPANTLEKLVQNNIKKNLEDNEKDLPSPEPENGNFWDKIGKRETVYLMKRKQNIDESKEKHKRALFWFPEDKEADNSEQLNESNLNEVNCKVESVDINSEGNQPNEREKEKLFDKEINSEVEISATCSDSDISKYGSIEKNTEAMNVFKEITTQMNSTAETDKNIPLPKILSKVREKDDLTLANASQSDNDPLKAKISCAYKQNKNIVKSASLEKVNDSQFNVNGQKKTKSEKSKKILKIENIIEANPLQVTSPTIHQKPNNAKIKEDITEDNIAMVDKTHIHVNNKQETVKNSGQDSDIQKPVCPIHPYGLQKVKEQNIETDKIKIGNSTLDSKVVSSTSAGIISNPLKNESSTNSKEISSTIENESKNLALTVKNSGKSMEKRIEVSKINKTENQMKLTNLKMSNAKNNSKISQSLCEIEARDMAMSKQIALNEKNNEDEKRSTSIDDATNINQPPTSSAAPINIPFQNTADFETSLIDSSVPTKTKANDIPEVVINLSDIPIEASESEAEAKVQSNQKTNEENKAVNNTQKDVKIVEPKEINASPPLTITPKKVVKEEKALKPLIATPRPLQKKAPQVIHSSDSSDTSSEEETSEDDDDDTDSSEGSGEFFECENNADGRTSTGSNDSGFDSSAPASPATFSQIKKDCDVNCHRKCEKLTANLCGVNQRLLVEALATRTASKKGGEVSATSSSSAPAQSNNTDILEQQLEQSTAYDIYRKTGRFTPPARSIPRFRKYTVEDFQFIKVLGKGSFGKVLLAELRDTEYYYAVKCLKKDVVLEDDDVECTLIERKVLALGTNHPYLCHLFATFQTDSHLFFVMEFLNGGDLMFHIQQSGRFPEVRGRFYAAEIVSGLKFLHKRGIVYRDLKLDNILLDYEGHVRIADFGMCKLQIYLDKTADTFCGTPDYMAPEIIKGLKYNQTVDWWSFGVLLYEMLIGQSPFSGCDEDELFWSICNEMPSYPRFLSREALTILTRLLDKDARTRLGGTECMHGDIREQEFFHPIHWDRLERRELEAPFKPRVRHPMDTQYFDRAFTGERPRLTAVEPQVLRSMDQEPFRGFSYTNPNTTGR
ncbi:unnamed protein product [Arctia plantaginis]|uniref:Uncharacterized protein n=1 Tax=Arctia plantaginis TaxID=874455 RepID=A0A8S1AGJ9_ARCPL|nr:unnamed protein product [Arctia plantaginis]